MFTKTTEILKGLLRGQQRLLSENEERKVQFEETEYELDYTEHLKQNIRTTQEALKEIEDFEEIHKDNLSF